MHTREVSAVEWVTDLPAIEGRTAWGDDVVAGTVFTPVLVSPTLCRRLDQLAGQPDLITVWLTSWPAHLREIMDPFPGRNWPEIVSQPTDPEVGWWKWSALKRWLDDHQAVKRLAWCDDQLTDRHLLELRPYDPDAFGPRPAARGAASGLGMIRADLAGRQMAGLLLAPRTTVGITPRHLARVHRHLSPAPDEVGTGGLRMPHLGTSEPPIR